MKYHYRGNHPRKCPRAEGAQGSQTFYHQGSDTVSQSPQLQEISTSLHITPTAEDGHETPHHSNCRLSAQLPTSPQLQGVGMVPHITPPADNQAQRPTPRDRTQCSTAPQGSLFQVHSTHLMSPEELPLQPEGLTSQLRLPLAGPKLAADSYCPLEQAVHPGKACQGDQK